MKIIPMALAALLLSLECVAVRAADAPPLDPERGKQLMHKFHAGEALTPEEQAYLDRVREDIRRRRGQPGPLAGGAGPAPGQAATAGNAPPSYGPYEWVDSDQTAPDATEFKTFHSRTIDAEVSYLVYLPPAYRQDAAARYPVLYELPASGGNPKRDMPGIVSRVDKLIRGGIIQPMIVVGVNGLRGNTMYCDSRDGKWPLETVIIQDLIPHVDATYHTVASRDGRAVNGFSMGGFGAARLGFKFPEVFGVISIMAPPLLGPDVKQQLPAHAWSRLFPLAMSNDLDYFRANDPFTLVEKNADALRDRTVIRLVCHWENEEWLWPRCEQLHELMVKLKIQHEFYFLTNVKGHNRDQCLKTMGDGAFAFFSSSLLQRVGESAGPKPATAAKLPGEPLPPPTAAPLPAAALPTSADAQWEVLPDRSQGRAAEFRGADGTPIAAYIRKPPGNGPFPVIVWMHGGRDSRQATIGTGRSQKTPAVDLIKAGWAIYAADYRHAEKIGIVPIEFDDTVKAVEAARALPFADPKRIAYFGQSHGAQVGTRVVSRVELGGAVLCAPAAMDFIEIKKAIKTGAKLKEILSRILADLEQQYGAPMEEIAVNPAKYHYTSGITEAAQVRCPILIVNGRDDDNSPPAVIAAYVAALQAAAKPVETYEPAHGPHGFYTGHPDIPETQEAAARTVAFFRKCFGEQGGK